MFSLIRRLPRLVKPGGSLTGFTVTEKVRAVAAMPSLTVTVRCQSPTH